jgi:adenylate cyclase class 2
MEDGSIQKPTSLLSTMATEVEAKLKVGSFDAVRGQLQVCAAERIGCVRETNYILDRADDPLWKRDAALRVREIRVLDGPDQPARLTFKGPARPGRFKTREEIEVTTSDAQRTLRLLQAVGFEVALLYEKRRESWRMSKCLIELDELPALGRFVEIEGPDDDTIDAARRQLGLADAAHVPQGYVAMVAEHCRSTGQAERQLRFDL